MTLSEVLSGTGGSESQGRALTRNAYPIVPTRVRYVIDVLCESGLERIKIRLSLMVRSEQVPGNEKPV